MSETNDLRQGPVLAAAAAFEASQTVANRDALLAAIRAAKAPRFYSIAERIFVYRQGVETKIADCLNEAIATAIKDRLNVDLDVGWVPVLK